MVYTKVAIDTAKAIISVAIPASTEAEMTIDKQGYMSFKFGLTGDRLMLIELMSNGAIDMAMDYGDSMPIVCLLDTTVEELVGYL